MLPFLLLALVCSLTAEPQCCSTVQGDRRECVICENADLATFGTHVVLDFLWLLEDYISYNDDKAGELKSIIDEARANPGGRPGQCLSALPQKWSVVLAELPDKRNCLYLHGGQLTRAISQTRLTFAVCIRKGQQPIDIQWDKVYVLSRESDTTTAHHFDEGYIKKMVERGGESILELFHDICGSDEAACPIGPRKADIDRFISQAKSIATKMSEVLQRQKVLVEKIRAEGGARNMTAIDSAVQALRLLTSNDSCGHFSGLTTEALTSVGKIVASALADATGHSEIIAVVNPSALEPADDKADADIRKFQEMKACGQTSVKNATIVETPADSKHSAWTRADVTCISGHAHEKSTTVTASTVCDGGEGVWSPIDHNCFHVCSPLNVAHSNTSGVAHMEASHGASFTVKCDPNYSVYNSLKDFEVTQCQEGSWLPIVSCHTLCPSLTTVEHAEVTSEYDSPLQPSGSKSKVRCKTGFTLMETKLKEADFSCEDAVWYWTDQWGDPQNGTAACEAQCPVVNVPNGRITKNGKNATIAYSGDTGFMLTCNPNYTIKGTPLAKYNVACRNGEWHQQTSDQLPTECVPMCPPLAVERATLSGGRAPEKNPQADATKVGVQCAAETTLNGTISLVGNVTCDSGQWAPGIPRCLRMCPSIDVPFGKVNGTGPHRAEVRLRVDCDENYSFDRSYDTSVMLECRDGEWFPQRPACTITCAPISVPYASVTGGRNMSQLRQPEATKANVECNNGHVGSVTCQTNGEWFPLVPACAACPMNLIYAIENGASVNQIEFEKLKEKLGLMTPQFPIGVGAGNKRKTSIAVVTFAKTANVVLQFTDSGTTQDVLGALRSLRLVADSGTNTYSALSKIKETVIDDTTRYSRGLLCKNSVLLLFTWNMHTGTDASFIAEQLRRYENVFIFGVGLNETLFADLERIAGGGDRVATFPNVDAINVVSLTQKFRTQCVASDEKKAIKSCDADPMSFEDMQGLVTCMGTDHGASGCETIEDGDSSTFKCTCNDGWTCDLCDRQVNQCADVSSYCANHKNCENCEYCTRNATCICPAGWRTDWTKPGLQCSVDIDECVEQRPCKHGAECVNLDGDYMCNCTDGWTGKNCQFAAGCDNPVVHCADDGATCISGNVCKCRNGVGNNYSPYVSCKFNEDHTAESSQGHLSTGLITHTFDDPNTVALLPTNCPITVTRPCASIPNVPDFKVVFATRAGESDQLLVSRVFVILDEVNNLTFVDSMSRDNRIFFLNGQQTDLKKKYVNKQIHIDEVSLDVFPPISGKTEVTLNMKTDFSLGLHIVTDEGKISSVKITMPKSRALEGRLCGVLGNMNGNPNDDLALRNGTQAQNRNDFVDEWIADSFMTFDGSGCLFSREFEEGGAWAARESVCSYLSNTTGPFEKCLNVLDGATIAQQYEGCVRALDNDECANATDKCSKKACADFLEPLGQQCSEMLLDIGVGDWIWHKEVGCPDAACPQPEKMTWDPYAVACQPTCDCPKAPYVCPIQKPQPRCKCTGNDATHYFVFRDRSYTECINYSECPSVPEVDQCQGLG